MEIDEIVSIAREYFGKDRKKLRDKIMSMELNGKMTRFWNKKIKETTSHPYRLYFRLFDEVMDAIEEQDDSNVDWHSIGDYSWEFEVVLNEDLRSGYDWDRNLSKHCGGTAHILRVMFSDLLPVFSYDTITQSHNKKENYFGFTPLKKLTRNEQKIVDAFKKLFLREGYTYLNRKEALKTYDGLYSDLKAPATLADVLFTDITPYETDYMKCSDKDLFDPLGVKVSWKEFYKSTGTLIKREEWRYYPSGNGQMTILDGDGKIIEVKVYRGYGNQRYQEVVLDVVKELRSRRGKNKFKTVKEYT